MVLGGANVISFANNFEDVVLARIFAGRKNGFYVDVGANNPERFSITRYFYQLGWRGINIEPVPELFQKFAKARPQDINLNVACSDFNGEQSLFVLQNSGLSTFDEASLRESINELQDGSP